MCVFRKYTWFDMFIQEVQLTLLLEYIWGLISGGQIFLSFLFGIKNTSFLDNHEVIMQTERNHTWIDFTSNMEIINKELQEAYALK